MLRILQETPAEKGARMEGPDETNRGDLTCRDFIKAAGTGLIASRLDTPLLVCEATVPSEEVAQLSPSSGLQRISPNLYLLRDTCNVYLLKNGDRGLLIDFGSGGILNLAGESGVTTIEGEVLQTAIPDPGRVSGCGTIDLHFSGEGTSPTRSLSPLFGGTFVFR
jgi:hypothetical protein